MNRMKAIGRASNAEIDKIDRSTQDPTRRVTHTVWD